MNPEKTVKSQAKGILRQNNWLSAICVFITYLIAQLTVVYFASVIESLTSIMNELIINFSSIVPILSDIFSLDKDDSGTGTSFLVLIVGTLMISPLLNGVIRYFYLLAKHGEANYSEVFCYFGKKYFRALRFNLFITLRLIWRIILCMLPSILLFSVGAIQGYIADDVSVGPIIANLLGAAAFYGGLLLSFVLCNRYFLAPFLFVEHDELTTKELVVRSARLMNQFGRNANKLFVSLSGAIWLCVLVIPMLFAIPYILMTMSVSAKWIIALDTTPEVVTPEVVTPEVVTPEAAAPEFVATEAVSPEASASEAFIPEAVQSEYTDEIYETVPTESQTTEEDK